MKINLLTHESDMNSFNAEYFQPILNKYFNLIYYTGGNYDAKSTLIVSSFKSVINSNTTDIWYKELYQNGIKVVFDNLWDEELYPVPSPDFKQSPNVLKLFNRNWFWYNESMWYTHLGYNSYTPSKTYKNTIFMPMRRKDKPRDLLIEYMKPYLDNMIYSYVERGIFLPKDMEHSMITNFQRNFNPQWYDDTYFSLVSETKVDPSKRVHHSIAGGVFVTEKSFKPLAFNHPMLIFGQKGTLNFLRNLGFETFGNLFNEDYDSIDNFHTRLKLVIENVGQFEYVPYDKITLEKLQHNRNLFYDQERIEQHLIEEIFNPMMEFLND